MKVNWCRQERRYADRVTQTESVISPCLHNYTPVTLWLGRAIAQAVSRLLPTRRPGFEPSSGHAGFVVDKVELGQVLSEYFSFPCQFSFHRLLHTHHILSGAGTNRPVSGRRAKWTQSHPTQRNYDMLAYRMRKQGVGGCTT
jgi:hypothetical protein